MEFHPFADIWPLLGDAELAMLAADIKANGQRLPIIVYQRKILDGRNRFLACGKAGVPPRCEDAKAKTDQEALLLVVSLNEHRRHSSVEQRAFAAEQIAVLKHGSNQHQMKVDASDEVSTRHEAAKLMDISLQALERARAVRSHAPELEHEVRNGKISLSAAAAKARDKYRAKKPKSGPRVSTADVLDARAAMFKKFPPLTPKQVDPEFKGSPMEFVAKHGHVQIQTAAEKEATRRRSNRMDWTGAIGEMAAIAKKILALPNIDPTTWNETHVKLRQRFAENLLIIDEVMERIRASGMRAAPNGKSQDCGSTERHP